MLLEEDIILGLDSAYSEMLKLRWMLFSAVEVHMKAGGELWCTFSWLHGVTSQALGTSDSAYLLHLHQHIHPIFLYIVLKAEIKAQDPWEATFQMYTIAFLRHCSELCTLCS